jgi:hypothetical protein
MRTDDMSIDRIERILGAEHVAWILSMPTADALAYCERSAMGWWSANDCNLSAAYCALAELLTATARPSVVE